MDDQPSLNEALALSTAEVWYNEYGPFRNSYKMKAMTATHLVGNEWLVRFHVRPDTGFLYTRR
jgi:hypothetical protein